MLLKLLKNYSKTNQKLLRDQKTTQRTTPIFGKTIREFQTTRQTTRNQKLPNKLLNKLLCVFQITFKLLSASQNHDTTPFL